jgi:hypothetical protein
MEFLGYGDAGSIIAGVKILTAKDAKDTAKDAKG